MDGFASSDWIADWGWGIPLVIATVVVHVIGLGLMNQVVLDRHAAGGPGRASVARFAGTIGLVTLTATLLHGVEAYIWAVAYEALGAAPDTLSAVLYSLSAMTTYGHSSIVLEERWRLLGAIEALNGMLLFGLTTAFLFLVIQKIWPIGMRS